jgi:hypothetical protein
MAVRQIPNLTAVVALSPTAQIEIVQAGTTYRASAQQIANLGSQWLTVINDALEVAPCLPLYVKTTNEKTDKAFTTDPTYQFIPSESRLTAQRMEASQALFLNSNALTLDYSVPIGDNAMSAGPVVVSAVLNIPVGSVWTVV